MKLHSVRRTLIVAHRGASHAAPENTLPAFKLAIKEGADYIEGDFWLTKDGHIVCMHDPTTARVSTRHINRDIRRSTLKELKQLDIGAWKGKRFAHTTIPTLEEILQILPGNKGLFLEIKDTRPLFLNKLQTVVKSFALLPGRLRLIAFDPAVCRRAKEMFPEYKVYWLYNWYLARETACLSNSAEEILNITEQLPCDGLNLNPAPWIDVDFVRRLRAMNKDFCVYNVNRFDEALKLLTLGVDAIATNYPRLMRQKIERYFHPAAESNRINEWVKLDTEGHILFRNRPEIRQFQEDESTDLP